MMVFNFILELLWTGSGSLVRCVALFVFRKLIHIEKAGRRGRVGGTREWYFPETGVSAEMISKN